MDTYHKPMVSWLKEFALPDGYKPFDPDYAIRLADQLRAEGTADVPQGSGAGSRFVRCWLVEI
jgi:peptide/nickel transport system substrate-binding protein